MSDNQEYERYAGRPMRVREVCRKCRFYSIRKRVKPFPFNTSCKLDKITLHFRNDDFFRFNAPEGCIYQLEHIVMGQQK